MTMKQSDKSRQPNTQKRERENRSSKKQQRHKFIHNPHDKKFLNALKNHAIAKDMMEIYLPEDLKDVLDLEHFQPYDTKLVTPEYKEFEADIIYQIGTKNIDKALVLIHCEHQSTVDKNLPLRIWQYMFAILDEYKDNHKKAPLPLIFPLIIYTGEAPYTASTDLFDLFNENKNLAQKYMLTPIKLVDVCRLDDEDIKKHKYFGVSEMVFKYKDSRHFQKFLETFLPRLNVVSLQVGKKYAMMELRYIVDQYTHADARVLEHEIKQHLSNDLGDEAMTIAQQLEQRGIQQGMQQGIQQGMQQGEIRTRIEIAEKLLLDGNLSEDIVSNMTNLSSKQINEIKARLNLTNH